MTDAGSFAPLWASPPGSTIQVRLDDIGLDLREFANQLGTSVDVANGLLDGREVITVDVARRLSRVVGASVEFWVTRDCQYRDDLLRVRTDQWLGDLPVKEMTKFGWIAPETDWASRVNECLSFFGVEDLDAWQSTYEPMLSHSLLRISEKVARKPPAIAAWLRQAMREASAMDVSPWSHASLRESVDSVKALSRRKDPTEFLPKLQNLLAAAGVALVVVRSLPGCPASGAARFLSSDRAMVVVSVRYLADDQFWFTVMHEIGHLLLHGPDRAILDDPCSSAQSDVPEEQEANDFAAEVLLPLEVRAQIPRGRLGIRAIISLAGMAGVSPGVVVGQLQFDGQIGHDKLNYLKRHYKWNGLSLEMA